MKDIVTVAASWLFLTALAFFVARFVLFVRLVSARIGVRLVWAGIPGYLERKYLDAPDEVKLRLGPTFRVHQALKMVLLASIAAFLLGLLTTKRLPGAGR